LAYNVAQHVSNFGERYILREDNISNVVCLLNEEKEFARTKSVTNHDVRAFFEEDENIVGFPSFPNYHMFMVFL
jgi:hypothetical protein